MSVLDKSHKMYIAMKCQTIDISHLPEGSLKKKMTSIVGRFNVSYDIDQLRAELNDSGYSINVFDDVVSFHPIRGFTEFVKIREMEAKIYRTTQQKGLVSEIKLVMVYDKFNYAATVPRSHDSRYLTLTQIAYKKLRASHVLDNQQTREPSLGCGNLELNEAIVSLYMRYVAMSLPQMHISLPRKLYDTLSEHTETILECFSSPLTAEFHLDTRIWRKARDQGHPSFKPVYDYCSMFEEDKMFGSHGDFFKMNRELLDEYSMLVMHPPFIASVILQAVNAANDLLNDSYYSMRTILMVVPLWTDASYYAILENHKYKLCKVTIHRQTKMLFNMQTGEYQPTMYDFEIFVLRRSFNTNDVTTFTEIILRSFDSHAKV